MTMVSLEQRLEVHRGRMTPAVLRVVQVLLNNPERSLVATAAEIAESARTSDATVVRAVQILGYSGLPELRRSVSEQLSARYDPRETLDQSFARVRDDPRSVLDTVIDDAMILLAETRRTIDHGDFMESVELLTGASRIVIVGWGSAGAAAQYVSLALSRMGCPAVAETQSGFLLSDALASLKQDDVVLLLAPLLHVHEIDVTLDTANSAGAKSVLVTALLGEKLRDRVTHVLTMASPGQSAVGEFVAQVAILDALILGIASNQPDRARDSWNRINALRKDFATSAFVKTPLGDLL